MDDIQEMRYRGHSLRNFDPAEFYEKYDEAEQEKDYDKVRELRKALKRVESGRFYPVLEANHKMFAALDPDEKEAWAEANPVMMEWTGVYGLVEDLTGFPEYSSAEK